jgi:hypothetical protein
MTLESLNLNLETWSTIHDRPEMTVIDCVVYIPNFNMVVDGLPVKDAR